MHRIAIVALSIAFMIAGSRLEAATVNLLPGASQAGAPGATIGFGFDLTNDSAGGYIVVASFDFLPVTSVGTFTNLINAYLAVNLVVIAPGASWGQAYAPGASGFGEYAIDPLAPPLAFGAGTAQLLYDVFSVDPNDPAFDPGLHEIALGQTDAVTLRVDVEAPAAGIPEPASWLLLASGLIAIGTRRRGSS